jgi:FxsC-like protein
MSDLWFFLSYARRNDRSYAAPEGSTPKLIRQLYEGLAAEIISGTNTGDAKTPEKIGFFDQTGIEPGDKWDEQVADALGRCRVMLCLFTRNYFNSTVSGQEVQVFLDRVAGYANNKKIKQPPLVIPILWHSPDRLPAKLPDAVSDLQYTYDEFSKVYAQHGLELLMRLTRLKDDYEEFLVNLGKRVIDVAEQHTLPPLPAVPALKTVKNAFAPPAPVAPPAAAAVAGAPASTLANCGPGFAHFVFVAGQQQELQTVRNTLTAYDSEGRLWKPYFPDVDRTVALFTQRAATDAELQHEVLPLSNALLAQLEAADDSNTIVVLVVDPWTLNVQSYQDYMKSYDKRNLVSCAVLVVWNPADQNDRLTPPQLLQKVRETFKNSITNQNLYVREMVKSPADFNAELVSAIVEIRRRLDARAKLYRPIDSAGFTAIPQVATPSAPPSGNTP